MKELDLNNRSKKGFTLIELLVVIAIIGIISGVALVQLNKIKSKVRDTRIIYEMIQLRNKAEILFLEDGDYRNMNCNPPPAPQCDCSDLDIKIICQDLIVQQAPPGQILVHSNGINADPAYCVRAQLNSGKYWCIDSKQTSREYSQKPACTKNPTPYYYCE